MGGLVMLVHCIVCQKGRFVLDKSWKSLPVNELRQCFFLTTCWSLAYRVNLLYDEFSRIGLWSQVSAFIFHKLAHNVRFHRLEEINTSASSNLDEAKWFDKDSWLIIPDHHAIGLIRLVFRSVRVLGRLMEEAGGDHSNGACFIRL